MKCGKLNAVETVNMQNQIKTICVTISVLIGMARTVAVGWKQIIVVRIGKINMSLDKAIQYGKEHRRPYKGAKAIDKICRNHGSCGWCKDNRTYANTKREQSAESEIKEFGENI